MSFTRSDVTSRARRRLRLWGYQLVSLADEYSAFNDLQRDWAIRTKCLGVEVTFNLVAGTSEYALEEIDPRIFEVRSLRYRASSTSPFVPVTQMDYADLPDERTLNSGQPSGWASRGGSIVFTTTPSQSVTNGLSLSAYRRPDDLAEDATDDDAALEFPDFHREGLVWGMMKELCFMGADDSTLAAREELANAEYEKAAVDAARRAANLTGRAGAYASGSRRLLIDPRIPSHWG